MTKRRKGSPEEHIERHRQGCLCNLRILVQDENLVQKARKYAFKCIET